MGVALLDVNVLLALFWPGHAFHSAARLWFHANAAAGWATCTLSQAGFARIFSQPRVTGQTVGIQQALEILESGIRSPHHHFWNEHVSIPDLLPEIHQRIRGNQQLTDAILLDLAIRKGGRLVTLDRRMASLLAQDSTHRAALEIIPTPESGD
jgi:uncharacterized protein